MPPEFHIDKNNKTIKGISIYPEKSFKDLPPHLQEDIKSKRKTMQEAFSAYFSNEIYDGSKTILLDEKFNTKINEIYINLRSQNDTAENIFDSLNINEEINIRAAIAYYLQDNRKNRKDFKPRKSEDGKWIEEVNESNIYTLIDTIKRFDKKYFESFHKIEEIYSHSKLLEEKESKELKLKKYAKELIYLLEINNPELEELFFKILNENPSRKWHEIAMNSVEPKIFIKLLDKIEEFENHEYGKHVNDPRKQGRITESFLSLLNPEKEKEKLGESFRLSDGRTYSLFRLFTKKDLEEESKVLGHCVGNGNTYYFKIKGNKPEYAIVSLRDDKGIPKYTLEINTKKNILLQFKGSGDNPVNSLPENSELPLTVFSKLETAGIQIDKVDEDFDYSIVKDENSEFKKVVGLDKEYVLKNRNEKVVKSRGIELGEDTTKEELDILTQIPDLILDTTNLPQNLKDTITEVKGSLRDSNKEMSYMNLKHIRGNAYFGVLENVNGLTSLESIGGDASFFDLKDANGLTSLTSIGGDASFFGLKDASGLSSLTSIGGDADFSILEDASGLISLESIEANADFSSLENSNGLNSLVNIGEYASFSKLKDANGLTSLTSIGGGAYFSRLKDVSGLISLESIGGDASFFDLKDANGLSSLTSIGGGAYFSSLENSNGLNSLTNIGGKAYFNELIDASGLSSLTSIGGDADFSSLENSNGLNSLVNIGEYASFSKLKDANGLTSLTSIGGGAYFSRLKDVSGLISLESIGGDASFFDLKDANGLSSLTSIGGSADFRRLKDVSGLISLVSIGDGAVFSFLKNSSGLNSLTSIGGGAYFSILQDASGLISLVSIGGNAIFESLEHSNGLNSLKKIGGNADFSFLEDASGLTSLASIGGNANFEYLRDEEKNKIPYFRNLK